MLGLYSTARLALSAVLLLVCLPSIHSLAVAHNITDRVHIPSLFSRLGAAASHAVHRAAAVPAHPSAAAASSLLVSSVTSVYGCMRNLALGTLGCNITSVLTITGSGFSPPAMLQIANNVNCTVPADAIKSSTRIVTQLCPYYYPQQSDMWDVRIFVNDVPSEPLTAAISFSNTAPLVTSVTSSTCTVPPYNGCDFSQVNTFTVSGSNFLPPPLPPIDFYFWLGAQEFQKCGTRVETLRLGRFECTLPPFNWPFPQLPSPSQKYGGLAVVIRADWRGEQAVSNYLSNIVSFNQRATSSSSTGSSVNPGNQPPAITRVSGCEDSFNNTRNCPYPWPTAITITIYGSNFRAYSSSTRVSIGEQPCTDPDYGQSDRLLCSWNTSGVNYVVTGTTPLTLSLNSSAGQIRVASAVNVNEAAAATRPVIASVSGCQSYGVATTINCDRSMTLTIFGESFARYLPASLVVRQHSIRCNFPDNDPLAIECPLRDADLSDVPRNAFVSVSLQLGDRVSDPVPYVSFAVDGPVPPPVGSSGAGGGDTGDAAATETDDLVGMKLALLSMMIISLIVLVVALGVWVTGWWLAHRRSYVSQHGQAAVDARQVLLQ